MSAVPSSEQLLLRDEAGGICTLTMNRPAQMNLLTSEMLSALQSSLDEISMDDKVRLENALERINAEVKNTRAGRDGRNVCWREKMSGTNTKVTRCGTEAEMREAREGARDFLERPRVCGERCG